MRTVIVIWQKYNDLLIQNPLDLIARRYEKLGYVTDFDLLVMSGYEILSKKDKDMLKGHGYNVVDMGKSYKFFRKEFPEINRLSIYNQNCLLRWFVINDFYSGPGYLHVDADIVLNEDLKVIHEITKNMTFVLQGCPAFTVVNDKRWLDIYSDNFIQLIKNGKQYNKEAFEFRQNHKHFDVWKGVWVGKELYHDQDLMAYLIHKNLLPQADKEAIKRTLKDYILFDNPLDINLFNLKLLPLKYERRSDVDFLNTKRVLFWHLQKYFTVYLGQYILSEYFPFLRTKNRLVPDKGVAAKTARFLYDYPKIVNRRLAYKYFFEKNDFSGLMTKSTWWKRGVFK